MMKWGKRPATRASSFATYEAPQAPTIRLRGGYELTVDRFEYVSLGGTILARIEGDLPEPGYPVPRLALVVTHQGGRDRIRALPAPDDGVSADRWRAAFPLTKEIVADPEIEFSLYAAGKIVALDPPRSRSLDTRKERMPSRREQLEAQLARRERLLAGDDEPPEDETSHDDEPTAEEPVARPRRRPAPEPVDSPELDGELVEAELVLEADEVDAAASAQVAELQQQLAAARADAAKQHAEMRRALTHERQEQERLAADARNARTRADAMVSQIEALDRSVAKARGEAAAAEDAARESSLAVESAVADAAARARAEAEAAAQQSAAVTRESSDRLEECLRRLVATADRVAAAQAERETVQERLRGALFDIGGTDPEALVSHEQALSELLDREREALEEAWQAARGLVAAMPEKVAVSETAGR